MTEDSQQIKQNFIQLPLINSYKLRANLKIIVQNNNNNNNDNRDTTKQEEGNPIANKFFLKKSSKNKVILLNKSHLKLPVLSQALSKKKVCRHVRCNNNIGFEGEQDQSETTIDNNSKDQSEKINKENCTTGEVGRLKPLRIIIKKPQPRNNDIIDLTDTKNSTNIINESSILRNKAIKCDSFASEINAILKQIA